jgi:hypothetical protein
MKRRWWGMADSFAILKPTHDPLPWPTTFDGWVNSVFGILSPFMWYIIVIPFVIKVGTHLLGEWVYGYEVPFIGQLTVWEFLRLL